jgi:dipeptidyl aminopeptidase/acylaminoacyl peptidase
MTTLSLDGYRRLPRLNGITLSPDGTRLVLSMQHLSADGTKFTSALWELRTDGGSPARRLTWSKPGESNPAFLPDGSLLFSSARADPDAKDDDAPARLWRMPAGGGEAHPVLSVPGGIEGITTARSADVAVIRTPMFGSAADLAADAAKAKERKEAPTSAVLFDQHPIRHWDHDLGPRQPRLLRLAPADAGSSPEDLVPGAGMGFQEAEVALAPDGETAVSTWWQPRERANFTVQLVALGGGRRRVLAGDERHNYGSPAVSPDGRWVVARCEILGTPEIATRATLSLVALDGGATRDLLPDFDAWPSAPAWSPDSAAVYFTADERGRRPIYRAEIATGEVRRITSDAAFASLAVAPDGESIYAIQASYEQPQQAVRVRVAGGEVEPLPTPGLPLELPGRVEEVSAEADDGAPIRGWLVLPNAASAAQPAPLVLWVHGGPFSSWNDWSWRWNPHLLAERGYAVLLPDPALSTGYGQAFIQRAWGTWGDRVLADVEAVLDSVAARPDIDGERTAMMGGSFGGYMANWIAGHTDRFKAIVSHASLWAMDQFHGTTDLPTIWETQFGDPYADPSRLAAASPHRFLSDIRTPMLVIHGLTDYRVPVSEALRLYTDLRRMGVPAQYLLFPDENHWILKPGNADVWYQTVLAFLDHHVLGRPWSRPELL